MKNIIFRIALTVGIFTLSSCADELDLLPQQDIAEGVALSTDSNVKKALVGAYDALSSEDLYGGNILLHAELLAANGEISWVGTFNQPREIFGKNILTTNTFVRDTWTEAYRAINIANNVLGALEVVNEEDRESVEGEARFIRGTLYFELVKLFGQPYAAGGVTTNLGVPIVLTPSRAIDESSYVGRSTVAQVYAQIIDDLTTAEGLLPDENEIFATSVAAAAQLSRVYLQMEQFDEARDAANRVINYGVHSLSDTYAGCFNNVENSDEDIFAIQVNNQDATNSMQTYWSIPAYGGRDGDIEINSNHLDLYDPTDERLNLFYVGAGATRSGKWQFQFRNIPIIRLSEMYLTRAECNFRLGESIGDTPLNDINLLRNRVNLVDYITLTLDDILLERKLELAHEGQGIHDVKRNRQTVDGLAYNANRMVFPIPQREIDSNPTLLNQQNPGYTGN